MLCHSVSRDTDLHLIKDMPMCESGPKLVLSISTVHERKENVVKLHALILKHHVQLCVTN